MVGTSTATTLADTLLRSAADPARVSLIDADGPLTSAELGDRVRTRTDRLDLPTRSLVALSGDRSTEFVVTYLSLLDAGHVPVLAGDHTGRLASAWPVGASVHASRDALTVEPTGIDAPELHPDLALLMSTSGSTGGPKLVRLSHRNLVSNAESIAQALGLCEHDRGITSLPLHYCYGLSVLHSHLAVGAGIVLSDASVVDPCFRDRLRDHGVTNLAGVPHTYDLLERSGPELVSTPTLRLLTQAGGRLEPAAVRRWSERAASWGADFVVMYGQTEATARIACLPADLAPRCPGSVGRAIPGGTIELRPVDGRPDDVGEIVYRGPNVMMGYASCVADLGLGHELDELRTGDLARFHAADGVYEIVGRRSRFVKPFGLRIDLDQVEEAVAGSPLVDEVAVAGDDDRIVAYAPGADPERVGRLVVAATGLPARSVSVFDRAIPRTPSGKVDGGAMLDAAGELPAGSPGVDPGVAAQPADPAGVFAAVLGRADIGPDDTFVTLGGDSLSYVECSIRLERELGRLPQDWHLVPVSALAAAAAPRHRLARVDTTVVLRALGICLVVATHMRVWHVPGGAHVLLAVAGFNLARFMAPLDGTAERVTAGLRTAARAAVPTVVWVAVGMLAFGSYGLGTLLLVNNYVGPASHAGDHWHFWFVEVFVHLVLIATALLAIPAVHRFERRFVYLLPLGVLAVALVLRMDWSHMGDWYNLRYRTHGVAWFFVLGWLIQRSGTWQQRLTTTLVCLAIIPGFFQIAARDWRITALLVALVWARQVPLPRWSVAPVGVLAAASMWIYVSHFSIWPLFRSVFVREVAYVLTLASGVVVWFVAGRSLGLLNTWRQGRRQPDRQRSPRSPTTTPITTPTPTPITTPTPTPTPTTTPIRGFA
ncbi:AMP-binding protein [Ilumatobacter sp.]|uniref:AMP-binding protein n=1 Tax=Ilumatobacter sp. TaxID=1967498 RepID=UPI003AF9BB7F